eukprot:Selendium_serpulae@DN4191_c0_g1_i1.p1
MSHICTALQMHWKSMIGTGGCWFLLDVAFYGTGAFKTLASEAIFHEKTLSWTAPKQIIEKDCIFALVNALFGLPGYLACILLLKCFSPRKVQTFGFCVVAAIYGALCSGGNPNAQLVSFHPPIIFTTLLLGFFCTDILRVKFGTKYNNIHHTGGSISSCSQVSRNDGTSSIVSVF